MVLSMQHALVVSADSASSEYDGEDWMLTSCRDGPSVLRPYHARAA
jgi:hypothetical protein